MVHEEELEEFIKFGVDLVLGKPLKMAEVDAVLTYTKSNGFVSKCDPSGLRRLLSF